MERTWRIGEVAERTGLTRRTLRHYDELGLLEPAGRSSGDYRLYDQDDLLRLLQIQNLKALGLSLAEIAAALTDPTLDATTTLRSHLDLLRERIAAEQRLADQLSGLAQSTHRSWEDVLEAIALTNLGSHADPMRRLRAALSPNERSTQELFAALAEEDNAAVAEVLIWALAQRPGAAQTARDLLRTAAADRRAGLVRLLGKAGDRAAVPDVVGLLRDPDPATVDAAVSALAYLADPGAAAELAAALVAGRARPEQVIDAFEAIGPGATTALLGLIDSARTPVRLAAVEALGRIRIDPADETAVCTRLAAILAETDLDLRRAAALTVAGLGEAGRSVLAGLVDDSELGGLARRLLEVHQR